MERALGCGGFHWQEQHPVCQKAASQTMPLLIQNERNLTDDSRWVVGILRESENTARFDRDIPFPNAWTSFAQRLITSTRIGP